MSSTRKTRTTGTASVDACVGSGAMHDAELCRRIRELEDKVRHLEARDRCYHHWGCGHWHYTTPTFYYGTSTSNTSDFNVSNTVTLWNS